MLKLIDYFVPEKLRQPMYTLFKTRSLIGIYFFLLLTGTIIMVVPLIFDIENNVPMHIGILLVVINLFVLRFLGNLTVSSNLLCLMLFVLFVPSAYQTGGLFSDNLLWVNSIPIVAMLFSNRLTGFLWLSATITVIIYFYLMGIYPTNHLFLSIYPPKYYATSYSCLFVFIYCIVFIFKSEQHLIVDGLVKQNAALEAQKAEINEKNAAITLAQEQLKETNAELEQFAYAASHDLKEPLRMITVYTQMIQRRLKEHITPETEEFMGYVTDGTKRMQRLLDDLLEYSRLGKKGSIIEVDLNDAILMALQNLKIRITTENAEVSSDTLPKVDAVFSEMIQLFQNLISNGIKFRKTDGTPTVQIGIKSFDNQSFTIYVKDNGIGIAPENTGKIFGLFERLHNHQQYEGTGIGLATCKKIMETFKGKIWVESELEVGTTFFLQFPVKLLSKKV